MLALSNLTGCTQMSSELEEVQRLNKQPFRSMQEVMDTNAESMKYSSFSQRTAVADYQAAYNRVSEEQSRKCTAFSSKVLAEHNKNTDYDLEIMSSGQHDYWKNLLDDYIIDNPIATSIKEFSGYYFLTVDFTVKPNTTGNFLAAANYLGLDNCFKHDAYENPILNEIWIAQAFKDINAYRAALDLPEYRTFINSDTSQVYTQPTVEEPEEDTNGLEDGDELLDGEEGTNETQAEDETEETQEELTQPNTATTVENNSNDVYRPENRQIESSDTFNGNLRKLEYDVAEYEEVCGSSQDSVAFMPYLSQVYQSVAPSGAISGDGCYSEGINGMRDFGFNRTDLKTIEYKDASGQPLSVDASGTMKITFVFKQNEIDKEQLDYVLAYLESYKSNNDFIEKYNTTNYVSLPEFITKQIEVKVEELDRLINNGDINGLMRMDTIEDAGLALKLAQYRNAADITTYVTDVKGCLERHGNVYLIEVERTIADTPKDIGLVAQYKEKAYMVVRQKDLNFYINDIFTASRELTRQPEIHEISQQYRQIVNLNLSDVVTDEIQNQITSTVLNDWAYYSNVRQLSNEKNEAFGMYGQFNTNKSVLSAERLEYINSKMRNYLTFKGVNEQAILNIVPVTWIGGTEHQVELITKEFVNYPKFNEGKYLECYYLLSHFGNRWVIDDIQVIVEEDVSGQAYADRIQDFKEAQGVIKGEEASVASITEVTGTVKQDNNTSETQNAQ